jgi:hypothetical protein
MTSTCNPFICWLAVKDKLATFGRISKWGYVENVNCVFCTNRLEDKGHCSFDVPYSHRIW